jgi:vacuolar-type H+-ATPase subunit H
MNKKIKEASNLTNKLISDAVKNLQSNNDDYIIDYFDELVSSIKAKLGATSI